MLLEINDVIKKEKQSTVVRDVIKRLNVLAEWLPPNTRQQLTYWLNGFLPILGNN